MATTQEILDQLNGYTGDNIWEDVIQGLDLDGPAIAAADPSYASDVVVLKDGTRIEYEESAKSWVERS